MHFYSPFFFPEEISSGRYNHYLVDALRRRGHELTVVCSYPFYPEWKVSTDFSEFGSPVRVLRGGRSIRYPRSNILRRMILEAWFAWHGMRAARALDRAPADVIVDVYPPNLFAILRPLVTRTTAPVVAVVHDLQGIMLGTQPSTFRKMLGALIRSMERAALRRADKVVFLSHGMFEQAVSMYGIDAARCSVSYPFSTVSMDAPVRVPAAMEGSDRTLVYAGALGEKQAPEQLYELMDTFARRRPDFQVHIFSNGPHFNRLKETGARMQSPVRFNNLVASDELTGLLSRSTIQIIPQKLGLSHGAFPSKLPNLMETNTAAFAISDPDSEVSRILAGWSRGAVSNTWDVSANIEHLEALANRMTTHDRAADGELRHSSDEPWRKRFSVEELCKMIEDAQLDASTKPPREVPV